jgi:hypothetical protein
MSTTASARRGSSSPSRAGVVAALLFVPRSPVTAATVRRSGTTRPLNAAMSTPRGELQPGRVLLDLDAKLDAIRPAEVAQEIVAFIPRSLEETRTSPTNFNAWKLGRKGADNGVLLARHRAQAQSYKSGPGRRRRALTDLRPTTHHPRDGKRRSWEEDRFRDAVDGALARRRSRRR